MAKSASDFLKKKGKTDKDDKSKDGKKGLSDKLLNWISSKNKKK